MSVVKRLFVFLTHVFIRQHLKTYFYIESLKRPEESDVIISFHAIECLPGEKQNPENNSSVGPVQTKTVTEAREA